MFKRYFTLLFVLLMPVLAFGNAHLRDGCMENKKYSKDFTIDRRCYVTDEQKKQIPYSATVALVDSDNNVYCTGTIFQDNQDFSFNDAFKYETKLPVPGLFVYTAAHCIKDTAKIKLQNGKEIVLELVSGQYFPEQGNDEQGDWAVYKIPEDEQENLPYVDIAYDEDINGQLKVIGYGSLAVMSDQDIHKYKQTYVDFLKDDVQKNIQEISNSLAQKECNNLNGKTIEEMDLCVQEGLLMENLQTELESMDDNYANSTNKFFTDGGIITFDKKFQDFRKINPLPVNSGLKESVCHMDSDKDGCQTWNGNSGGGVFVNNKLIALVSRSMKLFGGKNHLTFLKDPKYKNNDFEVKTHAVFLQGSQTDNLNRLRGFGR